VPAAEARQTRWIEVVGRARSESRIVMSSDPSDPRAAVTAAIRPGGPGTSYVMVGACSQWRAADRPLTVSVTGDYEVDAIRLLR
jgi:hypothetical protein